MNHKIYAVFFNVFVFSFGCAATLTQVLNIREFLVIFYGNELVIGVVLGIWLAGISVGALIGSSVIDKIRRPYNFFYPIAVSYIVLLPVNIIFIRSLRTIFPLEGGQLFPIGTTVLAALICIAPLSGIVGFLFPLTVKIYRERRYEGAVIIGRIYLVESLGSLAGGAFFTYILADIYNPFRIIAIAGILFLVPVLVIILLDRQRLRKWFWGITTTAIITILLHSTFSTTAARLDRLTWKRRWIGLGTGSELILNIDSRYQNIAIAESKKEYLLYINCHYAGSFPDPYYIAPFAHLVMTVHPNPKNVLIIGEGTPQIINEVLRHPIKHIDYVTIDPVLLQSVRMYSKKIKDLRTHFHFQEGREFVKSFLDTKTRYRYDLVILQIPEPETAQLNRYYTVDFFEEVKEILAPDGMLVLSATVAADHTGVITNTYTASIYKSLKSIFSEIGLALGDEVIFFTGENIKKINFEPETLISRYNHRRINISYFNPNVFRQFLPKQRIAYVKEQLEKKKNVKENTDLKPITYYLNLILWDSYSGSHLGWMLRRLYNQGPRFIIVVISMFSLAWIIFHTYKRKKFDVSNYLYIMFATGLWSLAQMLTLIFLYQNHFGYIYTDIGLLVGLFMFGLSAGSYTSSQVLIEKSSLSTQSALFKSELFITAIILLQLILLVFGLFEGKTVYIALILLCGIGTGLQYPLLNRMLIEAGYSTGKTAGIIDSMDHLGGFLGAIITNIILIPIIGVTLTFIILLMLKLAGSIPLYLEKS